MAGRMSSSIPVGLDKAKRVTQEVWRDQEKKEKEKEKRNRLFYFFSCFSR
jgi:hypothetical protein